MSVFKLIEFNMGPIFNQGFRILSYFLIMSFFPTILANKREINCDVAEPDLEKFSPNSKYSLTKDSVSNLHDGIILCESYGLIPGIIKDFSDYESIVRFLGEREQNNCTDNTIYLLGSFKRASYTQWKNVDGSLMSFQLFDGIEPSTNLGSRFFAGISCRKKLPGAQGPEKGYVMNDFPLGNGSDYIYNLRPICQFRLDSPCFRGSIEAVTEEPETIVLGYRERDYFVGTTEETWKSAHSKCAQNHMHLLDFEGLEADEIMHAYTIMSNFTTDKGFLAQSTSFWTSGKFATLFTGNFPVKWEWSDSWQKLSRKSGPAASLKQDLPKGNQGKGKCITVSAIRPPEDETLTFSLSNCDGFHWYICYWKKPIQ